MKYLIFFSSFLLLHFITYSQPNIDKISWFGENGAYLSITKKKVFVQINYFKNSYRKNYIFAPLK